MYLYLLHNSILVHMLLVGWWCHGFTLCLQYMLKLLDCVDVGLRYYSIGQVVRMVNFKSLQHIVASSTFSGLWGVDKFHFKPISQCFYKVDATHVQVSVPFSCIHMQDWINFL